MCDEYEIFEYLESEYREQKKKRRRLSRKINNPFDMEEEEFIKEYRLSPDLVRELCDDLKPIMETNPRRSNDLSIERKVLAAIYVYAHGFYQKHTAKAQCIAQTTVSAVLAEVTAALNNIEIRNKYIKFPKTATECDANKLRFYDKFGIPGVVGCIDGTHIAIVKPTDHVERYICTKNYPSLNVQLENEDVETYLEDPDDSITLSDSNVDYIVDGRRIIDFQFFWSQLINISQHSEKFDCKLNFLKIVKEKQMGLVSKFDIKCTMCGTNFVLSTSDSNTTEARLDLNAGAVSGSIITGIGLSNLNEIIASLDLPTMPFRLYSKKHDAISDMWKTAAEETMMNAAKQEIEAAKTRGDVSNAGIAMIPVEADACWGKRSYKNNYSALSGVAAIIGENSGKVLHIGVRNKYCVICARASKKGEPAKAHKCTKNHSGSSSSMEQAILVEGFKNSIRDRNLIYNTLIADGDSSTYKSILESRPYPDIPIQKIECTNHLLRNYNGKNLLLQKDTAVPLSERKLLNMERLRRLRTAVRVAIRKRQQDSGSNCSKIQNLQIDILNSPKHIFGDHSKCESYYCTDKRKKEPNLVPQIPMLLVKLKKNASQLAYNSRSLLHSYTNNRAEQFNSIVAKMVGGKRVNFSLKDSYSTRCNAAVVSFNTGMPQYTFYKSNCHVSPGKSLKLLETRRYAKNTREVMARAGTTRKKIIFNSVDAHYGIACERPDMEAEDYERGKHLFLKSLKEQASKRQEIERATVLQAESSLWLELRRCILTASSFAKICKRRANQNSAPVVKSLLYSYNLDHITSIKHGRDNEPKALAQLSVQENINIEKCGLFIDEEYFYLGATPDGLCSEGLVEVKCPSSLFGIDPDTALRSKKLKCFQLNSEYKVEINRNHDWYYQIQGQLHIANKNICIFAVWTGPDFPLKTVRVEKDDRFWQEKMLPKLIRFYQDCLLPEIIDPRKARSMPLRQIFI